MSRSGFLYRSVPGQIRLVNPIGSHQIHLDLDKHWMGSLVIIPRLSTSNATLPEIEANQKPMPLPVRCDQNAPPPRIPETSAATNRI